MSLSAPETTANMFNESCENPHKYHTVYVITVDIIKWTLIYGGFLANGIILLAFLRYLATVLPRVFNPISMYTIFTVLFTDFLTLLTQFLEPYNPGLYTGYDDPWFAISKITFVINIVCCNLSNYLVVYLAFQRYITLCYPFRGKMFITARALVIYTATVVTIFLIGEIVHELTDNSFCLCSLQNRSKIGSKMSQTYRNSVGHYVYMGYLLIVSVILPSVLLTFFIFKFTSNSRKLTHSMTYSRSASLEMSPNRLVALKLPSNISSFTPSDSSVLRNASSGSADLREFTVTNVALVIKYNVFSILAYAICTGVSIAKAQVKSTNARKSLHCAYHTFSMLLTLHPATTWLIILFILPHFRKTICTEWNNWLHKHCRCFSAMREWDIQLLMFTLKLKSSTSTENSEKTTQLS